MAERADEGFELITLRNGVRAIREIQSGEVMHPSVGPWTEARTLYVEQTGLEARLRAPGGGPVRIYDVGLGGAANAVAALTCRAALGDRAARPLELISFERDLRPLGLALEDEAGFPFLTPWRDAVRTLLREGTWVADGVTWRLFEGEVLARLPGAPDGPELVFHDPFSPETNPDLWTVEAFAALRAKAVSSPDDFLLVTYSASTRTRASLLLAGFYVGMGAPIGTKKETTVAALKPDVLCRPLDARWLQRWERSTARGPWGAELTPEDEVRIRAHPQFSDGRG